MARGLGGLCLAGWVELWQAIKVGQWSLKEFEVMIKGGALGTRIIERSNKKKRSIFIQRDEIVWLVRTVEKMVDVETSEVFWDQSRAGYPWIIAQKRSNRHGRFLTVEEFVGRRRCGAILIPEGRSGQGWVHFISELKLALSSLMKERVLREDKAVKVVVGGQSYVEVLGWSKSPEEDCFHAYKEPIAGVPKWLKEASAEMGCQVLASYSEVGKKVPESNHRTGEVGVVSEEQRRT